MNRNSPINRREKTRIRKKFLKVKCLRSRLPNCSKISMKNTANESRGNRYAVKPARKKTGKD